MKRFLKAVSLVSLIAMPSVVAFAADATSPTDLSNFSPRLTLRGRYAFTDSTQKNSMDMFGQTARFGLTYAYKNIGGVLEVQAGENAPSVSSAPGENTIIVRRALATLDFVKMKEATVTFALGRDRLDGSVIYAPDAFRNLIGTNFHNALPSANEDGMSFKYMGQFDFGNLWGSVGYYNNAGFSVLSGGTATTTTTLAAATLGTVTPFTNQAVGGADTAFMGITQQSPSTHSKSRAMVAMVGTDVNVMDNDKVEARLLYGYQPGAIVSTGVGPALTNFGSVSGIVARDINDLEASVGYNHRDMIKGGVWFQYMTLGGQQTSTSSANNEITYGNADADTQTITTYGVGLTGNTKLFDLKDMLVEGDALTYGLGYQAVTGEKYSNANPPLSNTSETLNQFTLAAGYNVGPYTLDLNYIYMTATDNIYRGNSNNVENQNNASMLYLNAVVAL
jgi:hypothetical protein